MGKAKKGKKNPNDDDIDSDTEIEDSIAVDKSKTKEKLKGKLKTQQTDLTSEDTKKSKKKKSKSRGDDNSDVDQLSKDLEDLDVSKKKVKNKIGSKRSESADDSDSDNASEKKTKTKKSKKVSDNESDDDRPATAKSSAKKASKTPSKGGFSLLEVDSDPENIASEPEPESDSDLRPNVKKTGGTKDTDKKETGAKKGKKKKRKDDSDEDIEKVLAELEQEYAGVKKVGEPSASETVTAEEPEKKKEKIKKRPAPVAETVLAENEDDDENISTVKSAAQKKKDKKEREKAKKIAAKKVDGVKTQETTSTPPVKEVKPDLDDVKDDDEPGEGDVKDGKKKKKTGKEKEEKPGKAVKGPDKKTKARMQEALKKIREEEERMQREEEERIKREEEAEVARLEAVRLEQERKDKKKKKEKERKERLKAEGKLLTAKQKADRARAQAMLEALKAQGVDLPEIGEKKPRPGTRIKPNKFKKESSQEKSVEEVKPVVEETKIELKIVDQVEPKKEDDDVKDAWDAESSEDEVSEDIKEASSEPKSEANMDESQKDQDENGDYSSSGSDEDGSDDDSSSDESETDTDRRSDAEKKRAKALARIQKRREEAEKNRSVDDLRAAVVCVLGHVDTGKTKILDKLRRTNVQDGEAGGITQQIGATNVPIENIKEQTKIVKGFADAIFKLPGLLIIDTPGHESFSNLRNRGSSLCDIAILVVDIMHGLEPQTIESINLLKQKRTPFIVALNKIDRLYDWQTISRKDIRDVIKAQAQHTQLEFENRTKKVCVEFAEQSYNAALFYENPDPSEYISLVPTSAITGEGMGNLLALIVDNCQTHLAKRLMYSAELQATVLEVKAIPGLGTTIDAILVNGILKEGDTMLLAGTDGPIVTQIRSLLMPQPMRELRVKNAYIEHREVKAAQGVKIAAKELEKTIAGLNLVVAHNQDEVDVLKEEVARELKSALSSIKLQERGVFVQASTLGSLEALLDFLKVSKIPYAGIRIGPVVKKDVMKASIMLEHDSQYATILAFDVKIERDAQDLADNLGVKIFQADIIYHLFDKFTAFREELQRRKRDEFKTIAVFPCKLKVLPQFVFNSRDPIVCGVMVEAGIIKEGTPICVPSKEFVELGIVTSIESNHKQVETARKGMEVCIKIEPIPGDAPKMFGRHFDETDMLVSKISRQSIDACKDYFRADLTKTDWQLMVELKKLFQIL